MQTAIATSDIVDNIVAFLSLADIVRLARADHRLFDFATRSLYRSVPLDRALVIKSDASSRHATYRDHVRTITLTEDAYWYKSRTLQCISSTDGRQDIMQPTHLAALDSFTNLRHIHHRFAGREDVEGTHVTLSPSGGGSVHRWLEVRLTPAFAFDPQVIEDLACWPGFTVSITLAVVVRVSAADTAVRDWLATYADPRVSLVRVDDLMIDRLGEALARRAKAGRPPICDIRTQASFVKLAALVNAHGGPVEGLVIYPSRNGICAADLPRVAALMRGSCPSLRRLFLVLDDRPDEIVLDNVPLPLESVGVDARCPGLAEIILVFPDEPPQPRAPSLDPNDWYADNCIAIARFMACLGTSACRCVVKYGDAVLDDSDGADSAVGLLVAWYNSLTPEQVTNLDSADLDELHVFDDSYVYDPLDILDIRFGEDGRPSPR
ncbi:hypothetical protein Q5752_000996 [Cryptotrichosporon argae]